MSHPCPSRPPEPNRLRSALQAIVSWTETDDVFRPYEARVDGRHWVLELGDFPAEPLYTLHIDGEEIGSFDNWPETWTRPTS